MANGVAESFNLDDTLVPQITNMSKIDESVILLFNNILNIEHLLLLLNLNFIAVYFLGWDINLISRISHCINYNMILRTKRLSDIIIVHFT